MKIILLFIFAVFPAVSIACSPPAIQMSEDDMIKWSEANPCPMDTDIEKYNAIRRQCIEKHAIQIGMTYEDYVDFPPPGTNVFSKCNHEASENSRLPLKPNKENQAQ